MWCKFNVTLLLALALSTQEVSGYKILGLYPFISKSNVVTFLKIMEELAKRGHEVHVLSHYPRETALVNYTDLSVAGTLSMDDTQVLFKQRDIILKYDILNIMDSIGLLNLIHEHENVMKSEAIQKLLTSNEKYDLIMTEAFVTDMMLGFVHKFKVPFILLSSLSSPPWTSSIMANPQNPAFVPVSVASKLSPKMTFFERFTNTFSLVIHLVLWYGLFVPANQKIMYKYFGDDVPPLLDIYKNASLMLINNHPTVTGGRPLAPTIIDVGGVHIDPAKKLPRDIETFIEESQYGVVYFCMGSVLKTTSLPEEKKNAFFHTFSRLKERVLWKFEDESLLVPDNVLIKKWMPQRDILAHPKVKLFVSHGGLLGTLEAVSEGKPIVGIPIFAEQGTNIRAVELQGVAKFVDYNSINNETIYEAVQEMLKPKYAQNAKELSKLFHDRPMSPMDTAVYWIEYVIRNNGAKNLRSPAVDLAFYQYLLIDVFLFFFFCLISCSFVIYCIFRIFLCGGNKFKSPRVKLKSH